MSTSRKILVTGPASQVGIPICEQLAQDHEVWGLARFGKQADRDRIEALGVRTVAVDLAKGNFDEVPRDFDYVIHLAVVRTDDFDADLTANAEGTGLLMSHCRDAKAFLHCSSGAVYQVEKGQAPIREIDPLGDNHRGMMPTYSICKIASEAVARYAAREFDLPTVIARFSVPYGDNGGWPWYHLMMMKAGVPIPIHPDRPSTFNLIHADDYVAHIPKLFEIASVPATIINWTGSEPVTIEEWCTYLGELTGLKPEFRDDPGTIPSIPLDATLAEARLGGTRVQWRDGIRRMVAALNPELLKS